MLFVPPEKESNMFEFLYVCFFSILSGLLHISNVTRGKVTSMNNLLAVDEKVKVMVVKSMFPDKISLRYEIIFLIMPYSVVGINAPISWYQMWLKDYLNTFWMHDLLWLFMFQLFDIWDGKFSTSCVLLVISKASKNISTIKFIHVLFNFEVIYIANYFRWKVYKLVSFTSNSFLEILGSYLILHPISRDQITVPSPWTTTDQKIECNNCALILVS